MRLILKAACKLLFVLAVLAGCSSKERLKGTREALALSGISDGDVAAKSFDAAAVVVDQTENNSSSFVHSYFNASHCYPPLKFSLSPHEIWEEKLDFEASDSLKMTSSPVAAEGKVFCVDAGGIVYALDQNTGKRLWRRSITVAGKDGQIGSAIAYDNGRVIVTSSFAEGFCLNSKNGEIIWRIKLPSACKGDGLTVHAEKAFILCNSNRLLAIDINTGKTLWSHSGMMADVPFISGSSVAIDNGVVYVAYSSGEVYALLEATGTVLWDSMLSKFSLTHAANAFSHPRACPVVSGEYVYFTAANQRTTALNAKTGQLLWKSDFGGTQTPVVSGNSIFIFNSKSELACLNKDTGQKRWAVKITNDEDKVSDWYGMVFIKDHLVMISQNGEMIFISVYDGKVKKIIRIDDEGDGIPVNPIIANGTMYILMNCGKVAAYK